MIFTDYLRPTTTTPATPNRKRAQTTASFGPEISATVTHSASCGCQHLSASSFFFQSPPPRTSLAMVKTRSKKTNEPVPVTQASRSRKCQTSNADEVQNKRTKIDDVEESNDDQSKKKKGKGTKKKGKQPRYVISTSLRSIFLIFFFFAGKRLHRKLPRMLQLMLQVLLFIYPSKYSRLLTIFF